MNEAQESMAAQPEPIPSDCGICRRASNCLVFQSFVSSTTAALSKAAEMIPGIALKASLEVRCPEFAMSPEVEAEVRQRLSYALRAVPEPAAPESIDQGAEEPSAALEGAPD